MWRLALDFQLFSLFLVSDGATNFNISVLGGLCAISSLLTQFNSASDILTLPCGELKGSLPSQNSLSFDETIFLHLKATARALSCSEPWNRRRKVVARAVREAASLEVNRRKTVAIRKLEAFGKVFFFHVGPRNGLTVIVVHILRHNSSGPLRPFDWKIDVVIRLSEELLNLEWYKIDSYPYGDYEINFCFIRLVEFVSSQMAFSLFQCMKKLSS